ncbi:hypothetical protein TGME49_251665 [Toxoplasma gondii ME49]|uniref:Uncharacterized protein n=2 Tax=Toxoplasma gondii TaxID=5811 RepID=A0A125YP08_TOXGV|nr:hypothetical protein TGME49_251665 [Toxoplasma gondii ME49]EPT25232.1 hypothetical protein TGME49_251665 [Toxoplasma gondii ME49]ESS34567.1 hypothetical protein TGVEG_251665 [Toxoplasma gondii VEG]|eukprot:XP_018635090.1 hypothetical protein TGME49_251665 [Toxoplasma gondii ME49]
MQQVPRAELARLSPFFCSRNSVLHLSESGTLESHACTDTDGGVMLLQNISSRSMRAHPNHFGKRAFHCWQQGNPKLEAADSSSRACSRHAKNECCGAPGPAGTVDSAVATVFLPEVSSELLNGSGNAPDASKAAPVAKAMPATYWSREALELKKLNFSGLAMYTKKNNLYSHTHMQSNEGISVDTGVYVGFFRPFCAKSSI